MLLKTNHSLGNFLELRLTAKNLRFQQGGKMTKVLLVLLLIIYLTIAHALTFNPMITENESKLEIIANPDLKNANHSDFLFYNGEGEKVVEVTKDFSLYSFNRTLCREITCPCVYENDNVYCLSYCVECAVSTGGRNERNN